MNRNKILAIFLPLVGLVVAVFISFGFAQLNQAMITRNSHYFDVYQYTFWVNSLEILISMGVMLFLFWFIMILTPRSKIVGWVFLIVGMLLAFFPALYWYSANFITWMLPLSITSIPPDSIFYIVNGGIGIIGLFTLVLPKNAIKDY